jgi:hypothetical protein
MIPIVPDKSLCRVESLMFNVLAKKSLYVRRDDNGTFRSLGMSYCIMVGPPKRQHNELTSS